MNDCQREQVSPERPGLLESRERLNHVALQSQLEALIEHRNHAIESSMDSIVQAVDHLTSVILTNVNEQDAIILSTCNDAFDAIASMEEQQERIRDQLLRFMRATTSSFTQIFEDASL